MQTEGYFRHTAPGLFPGCDVDQEWDLLSHRQAHRPSGATRLLEVIIDESALELRLGRPEIMAGQIRHMLALADSAHATVRVIPKDAAFYESRGHPFDILSFAGTADRVSVRYMSVLGAELASADLHDLWARVESTFRQVHHPAAWQDQRMDDAGVCGQWRQLEAQARAQAEKDLPAAGGWEQIEQALARAEGKLGGRDPHVHYVPFHRGMWGLKVAAALPQQALDSERIHRSDAFAVAAMPPGAGAHWQLFCTSFVFGYGTYAVGPARLERILRRTQSADLSAVVAEARHLLSKCGPVSAYGYLRGSGTVGKVPHWGPAFFTKLLYFADTPRAAGSALILDNQTAWMISKIAGMEHLVDQRNRSERWTPYRYGVYLAWMTMVSARLQVRPDFLEYALFLEARRTRRRRPLA